MDARPCAGDGCDRRLVSDKAWRALSVEQRAAAYEDGFSRHGGGELCTRCYGRERRRLAEPLQASPVPAEIVVEEWHHLRDRHRSRAANIREAAPRIGMSPAALEKALDRLGISA